MNLYAFYAPFSGFRLLLVLPLARLMYIFMAYNARPACDRQGGRVVGIGRVGPKAGQTEGFYDFVMKFVRCKFDVASGCFSYIPSPP